MKGISFKKALGIILFIVLIITILNVTVSARYQYISNFSYGFSINSNGLATCTGYVKPTYDDKKTTLTVELQKCSNGSWVYVDSWSDSRTGANSFSITELKYVISGKYRVVVTAYVYSSSGTLLETTSCTSSEITYY